MRTLLAAALMCAAVAQAQDEVAMQRVEVPGEFSTEQSYRRMLRGVEEFESMRAKAPQATLRFRMYGTEREVKAATLRLALEGESVKLPLEHDADASFALPLNEAARKEDAALVANRRSGSVFWKPYVSTAGLAPDTRRLGDLRVQCKVTYASGLQHSNRLLTWVLGSCGPKTPFYFLGDREIFAVTVKAPGRERQLFGLMMPAEAAGTGKNLRSRYFHPPIEEERWPDDSLVQIHYVDSEGLPASAEGTPFDAQRAQLVAGQTRKDELPALLARGKKRQLAQGRELWLVLERAPAPDDAKIEAVAELALLFDADGVLRKHQVRKARVERKSLQVLD